MHECNQTRSWTKCIKTGPLHQKLAKLLFKLAIDAIRFFYKNISKRRAFSIIALLITMEHSELQSSCEDTLEILDT